MPTPETTQLFDYINQLISATSSGALEWTRANPTTFTWNTSMPQPATLSLQLVESRGVVKMTPSGPARSVNKHYVFQVIDPTEPTNSTSRQRLSVNGADDATINQKLQELYETIRIGISQRGLEFLKSILPPVKEV